MKKIAILMGVLLAVSCAFAQPPDVAEVKPAPPPPAPDLGLIRQQIIKLNNPLNKVDLSSPENTVRSFVWASNNFSIAAARQCVFNAQSLEELRPLQDIWDHGLKSHVNLISDLHAYRDGESAVVTLRLYFLSNSVRPHDSYNPSGSCERLHLMKFGEIWQILPEKKVAPENVGRVPVAEDLMMDTVLRISKPPSLSAEESLQQCQSNLK